MTLRVRVTVSLHVRSYDYYDMTLSTDIQGRPIINMFMLRQAYDVIMASYGNQCDVMSPHAPAVWSIKANASKELLNNVSYF